MKSILLATALTLGASAASAATIDFESFPHALYLFEDGPVSFTDGFATITAVAPPTTSMEIAPDVAGVGTSLWIYNESEDFDPTLAYPSVAKVSFARGVSSLSIELGDIAYDQDSIFLAIFDADDLPLGYIDFLRDIDSSDMVTLALSSGSRIAYALFGTNDYDLGAISVDNLTYEVATVPVPAGGLLLASALGLLGLKRRRRAA
ncbi:hypothetical protein [Rubellimicrobium aerolatum]|uniref:VPLPA-CTERM sorting domain-containing protein n=1 Tax=Rubellimicrobium aerolatum TaxID=490979 RepID=A0ABW0SDD1_9RHOB|nr:hypothetical protein [Rubellimicrobium aerolatum]MBP1805731.1 hypothetical protein [Rubellimicrobium aerolatum]